MRHPCSCQGWFDLAVLDDLRAAFQRSRLPSTSTASEIEYLDPGWRGAIVLDSANAASYARSDRCVLESPQALAMHDGALLTNCEPYYYGGKWVRRFTKRGAYGWMGD